MVLDNFRKQHITWDKANRKVYENVRVSSGDENGRTLAVQIINDGVVEDLTGFSLNLAWETRNKTKNGLDAFEVVDLSKGQFVITYKTGMLQNVGNLNAQLVLMGTDASKMTSENFTITVFGGVGTEGAESSNEFSALTKALATVNKYDGRIAKTENEIKAARGTHSNLSQRLLSQDQQLAEKANEANVRKKSELIGLNDAASDLLQALSDAPGTPVNINSVPKDRSVTVLKTTFINSGENLLNKNADDNVKGKMLLANGTEAVYASGVIASINVNPNDVITGFFNPTTFAANAKAQMYNSEGVKIETLTPVFSGEIGSVKIPDNALIHHMKVNVKDVNLSTAMFVKGSTYPPKYIPFDYMLDETFTLNKKQSDAVVKIQEGILNPNPLAGKTIIFDGDSIMNAINDPQDGWAGRMATKNAMTYTNYAKDGATITAGIMAGSNPRHWVSRSIDGYRSDADIIVVEGGTNDADLIGVSNMGEISVGFDAVLDDTSFTGAVESTLKQLIVKYPGKKIVFIIAHRMGSIDQQNVRRTFFDRIIECCEKWGIPYLDIWKNSYLNSDIPVIKDLYFSDKQHLKTTGYDLTFPMVESFIKK